jgi:hypothetical protein
VRQEQDGVLPRWCSGAECVELAARAASGPVIHLEQVVGVVVPTPPSWI